MNFDLAACQWTRPPKSYTVTADRVSLTTEPHTDLWQRTYYHFRNDNAPLLQLNTEEQYFSFTVKCDFQESHQRFDQCGVVLYLDSENWLKASVEYENESFAHLGAVVTNHGFSDWSTQEVAVDVKSLYFRLSRRGSDYRLEASFDGQHFAQLRVAHLFKGDGRISFGIYACSPEESSFSAHFSEFEFGACQWAAHDGQSPDADLI